MLGGSNVCATIAVKDLAKGVDYYTNVLGLKKEKEDPSGVLLSSATSKLFVYQSEFAGTNQATYAAWNVSDVDACVTELKGKGVTFEHYEDMPEVVMQGDVHVWGDTRAAWFKDPDGNILNVVSGM